MCCEKSLVLLETCLRRERSSRIARELVRSENSPFGCVIGIAPKRIGTRLRKVGCLARATRWSRGNLQGRVNLKRPSRFQISGRGVIQVPMAFVNDTATTE